MDWYLAVLRNYAGFSGRAHRTEYWMFVLINMLVYVGLIIVGNIVGAGDLLSTVYSLGVLIPSIAVGVRRLHDTDRTGWWMLIALLPLIGIIVLIVFTVMEGTKGPNQYGPDPWDGPASDPATSPGPLI